MNTKALLQSKTVWIQVITFISTFVPAVGEWLGTNGVTILQLFTAINVIIRFVTHGKIKGLFKGDDHISPDGVAPLFILVATLSAALATGGLVSCSQDSRARLSNLPVRGTIFYKHLESGAKGGLTFEPDKTPLGYVRVPIFDKKTGEVTGWADVEAGGEDVAPTE